ncbi:DUF456 domain-containing protein [soil metagenome]
MDKPGLIVVGLVIAAGLVGGVVAAVPGLILVYAAVFVWALVEGGGAWVFVGIATVLLVVGEAGKYILPGRRLKEAGVPKRSMVIGGVFAIIGFFVIPVVGLFVGFPLGVYLSERQRLGDHERAWPSTKSAMKATGLSILIELTAALFVAGMWLVTVLFII